MRRLLQSFLNATLLLVVVLVALCIWLSYRIEDVAADLITKVDLRVVDAVERDLRDAAADFDGLRHDLGNLNDQLAQLIESPEITLSPDMRSELNTLNANAKAIESAVAQLTEFDGELSDRQIREIGKVVSEVIVDARGCSTR